MTYVFFTAAAVAVLATLMVITRTNAVHALLYLITSLLAIAIVFYTLGAPFVAALEVIIYAGAVMVLFVFVIMMLNLGPQSSEQERAWFTPRLLLGPGILGSILLLATISALLLPSGTVATVAVVTPHQVGAALYGPYLLGVELSSQLLLAGLLGAYHLARR